MSIGAHFGYYVEKSFLLEAVSIEESLTGNWSFSMYFPEERSLHHIFSCIADFRIHATRVLQRMLHLRITLLTGVERKFNCMRKVMCVEDSGNAARERERQPRRKFCFCQMRKRKTD